MQKRRAIIEAPRVWRAVDSTAVFIDVRNGDVGQCGCWFGATMAQDCGIDRRCCGAAALRLDVRRPGSARLFSLHGDERFPLMSVCKLPIAMNMLALVDEGKFRLKQEMKCCPAMSS